MPTLNINNDVVLFPSANVGIGTTAPQSKLHVARAGNANGGTILMGLGGSGTSKWSFLAGTHYNQATGSGNGSGSAGVALIGASATETENAVYIGGGPYEINPATVILFNTYTATTHNLGGLERMRITSGGNVLIGTTTDSGNRLRVVGGSTNLALGANGNVLDMSGAAGQTCVMGFDGGGMYQEILGSSSATRILRLQVYNGTSSYAQFFIDGVNNYIYTSTNINFGIGSTAPSEKLHVDGSTLITYNNSFQSTNSVGNKAILARVSPTAGIINYAEYATATNLNGFVIGSDDARVKGNIATDSLEFITNTSTRMTVLSSGNVGINTTTPGSTLHVIGDVLIQTGALGVGVNPSATDGRIDASNDIVAFQTSDRRLKENITPIANALDKVKSLTGVEFDWKEETKHVHGYEGHDTGIIAQEVQAVMPTAVRTNDSGYLSVRYEKMIALLVEAMKEQQAQIEELKKLIK